MRVLSSVLFLFISYFLYSQITTQEALAKQYMSNGEYEKARVILEELYKDGHKEAYNDYLLCLIEIGEYKEALKVSKSMYKTYKDARYLVDNGYVYMLIGDKKMGEDQYNSAIKNVGGTIEDYYRLGNYFMRYNEKEKAIKLYIQGKKLLGDYSLNYELASIYRSMNRIDDMFKEYIELIDNDKVSIYEIQNIIQLSLSDDSDNKKKDILFNVLLKKVQDNPDNIRYSEMLLWLSIQKGELEEAYVQSVGLSKRRNDNGYTVFNMGTICESMGAYDISIKCYNYIIDKGKNNPYYINAKMLLPRMYLKDLERSMHVNEMQYLENVEKIYVSTIEELGKSNVTGYLIKDYAYFLAFYMHNTVKAQSVLDDLVNIRGLNPFNLAEYKLLLGDILLINGEEWNASLIYMQVENDFKNDTIGYLAKYKNAKLLYYIGEFNWSKSILDILKASTSKLISNDAMELASFIEENTEDDSLQVALKYYSRADFYKFQNKYDSAKYYLDSIFINYGWHGIVDDAIYSMADICIKKKQYNEADSLYNVIVEKYGNSLFVDEALYERAKLNDYILNNREKAKELYQKLLLDYPGSINVYEARRRFRQLRGDVN